MVDYGRLCQDIGKFLEVYKILTPEARAAFEAQMDKIVARADEKSKALYRTLQQAAKDGLTTEEAVDKMKTSV
jgi:hypothetical protein